MTCANARHSTSVAATVSTSKYTKAHSLGDNYVFDPRDGWQTTNATDLNYKYRRDIDRPYVVERSTKHAKGGIGQTISSVLKDVLKGLKGIGKTEPVTITW